jgi:hypothetical protein
MPNTVSDKYLAYPLDVNNPPLQAEDLLAALNSELDGFNYSETTGMSLEDPLTLGTLGKAGQIVIDVGTGIDPNITIDSSPGELTIGADIVSTNDGPLASVAVLNELRHPDSPGTALPATATRIGELFLRTGATAPGMYQADDLVGAWSLIGSGISGGVNSFTLGNVEVTEVPDSGWSPLSLPSLDGWWRVSPTSTGVVPGQRVATLSDLSGGGRFFTQAVYAKKPKLVADGTNYALTFDGIDDLMQIASFPSRAVFESWVVFRWSFAVPGATVTNAIFGRESVTSGSKISVYLNNSGLAGTTLNSSGIFVADSRAKAANALVACRFLFSSDGTNVTLNLTTPTLGSVSTGTAAYAQSEGDGVLSLAYGNSSVDNVFKGSILEFGRVNGAMSAPDRILLNTYLSARYPGVI